MTRRVRILAASPLRRDRSLAASPVKWDGRVTAQTSFTAKRDAMRSWGGAFSPLELACDGFTKYENPIQESLRGGADCYVRATSERGCGCPRAAVTAHVSWVRRPALTRASATLCHLALSL